MLAVVKKPHIELSINGEHIDEFMAYINRKYKVEILDNPDNEFVNVEDSLFYKEMNKNRIGNLLAGSRLKSGLTQNELAKKINLRQNIISEYENGKRKISTEVAKKICTVLNVDISLLQ